jgi:hypothetical protein
VFSRRFEKNYLKRVTVRKDGVTSEHSSSRTVKKTDTVDRENAAGEGITKKNPGAGLQDREDNVSSLSGARLCNE